MMDNSFDQLVVSFSNPTSSIDHIQQLITFIEQQTDNTLLLFISQSYQSLLILEQWAWEFLSQNSLEWINQSYYIDLLSKLASFNKMLIFTNEKIDNDLKIALLFPETIDQLDNIFKHIEENTNDDDDNPYLTIINLYFDNHSYFLHENLQYHLSPILDHIGDYFTRYFLLNEQFKVYLAQLQQPNIIESKITSKMLFYMRTCLSYLYTYIGPKLPNFRYTAAELIGYLGDHYLQIIRVHSRTIALWNNEMIACMASFIAFICRCVWWNGNPIPQLKLLLPTEQITCEVIENAMRISGYKPFYEQIRTKRSNDITVLLEAAVFVFTNIVHGKDIDWVFRANISYQKILLNLAERSVNDIICLSAYNVLIMVLTDEQAKELKLIDATADFCFTLLEHAWQHPTKMYKQIHILTILEGIRNFVKMDQVQQKIANSNKLSLFIEMSDEQPIVFDIIWGLSFNQDIQQQLRSNSMFMSKLAHLEKERSNEQMRKMVHGILWNLEINHEDHSLSEPNNTNTFDIMISYSHKEKMACQQIYDELTKAGYRVWIDFDQMHGNVMDAMAQAIEQSHTVIICMSEAYRKSNYCRAEAHYAFQRQRKIVPVLLEERYKPDGWLLFLIGQLLYVDFNKYEFSRAMTMLLKELNANNIIEIKNVDTNVVVSIRKESTAQPSFSSSTLPQNILEWTSMHVQTWLIEHDLHQMARLLANCNGRSLIYLNRYIKTGPSEQVLKLLQTDSLRRTGQDLSLIELSCFRSLMDEQKRLITSSVFTKAKKFRRLNYE